MVYESSHSNYYKSNNNTDAIHLAHAANIGRTEMFSKNAVSQAHMTVNAKYHHYQVHWLY